MIENYTMADLLDTLINERASRIELQCGSQPRILDIPGEFGALTGVLDVAPVTAQKAIELLQSIASPEQMRELDLCGKTRFTHIHSVTFGPQRIRVTGEVHHDDVTIHLENAGTAGS